MDIELKDIGTRNWVKTWLALRCFKDAILPFMKDKCAKQYLKDISYIKHLSGSKAYTCNVCKVDELKPPKKKKTNKVCPDNGSCGYLCDRIIDVHVKHAPNWSNTNSEFWSDDTRGPWERIKCFIHTPGYKEKKDISEADITAFVQICTSNELLKTAFGTDLECLEKVRDIRNGMCHSGSMAVSGNDFLTYVRLIEKALKLTIFDGYPSANEELNKLHTLEHDNGKVTIEDEMTAREETIEAIREVKKMLEQQVSTDLFKKEIANLKTNEDEHIRLLEQRFIYIEKHLLTLQEDHTKNKTRLEEHKKILSNIQKGIAAQHTTINEIAVDAKKILGHSEQIPQILAVVKQLLEKSLQSPTPITVHVPDSKLVVNVNISQGESLVSDVLVKSMNGVRQGVPITVLQQRLQTVVDELFKGGVDLIDVKNECMSLYIRFANLNSWLEFLSKYLTGIIAKAFLPVQEHLRTYLGFEDLELKVDVYEEDFEKCVQSILYQLAPTMLTVCGQEGERNDTTHTIDQLSLYVSPGRPVESYVTQEYVLTGDDSTYPNKLLIRGIPLNCTEVQIAKFMLEKTGYSMVQGSMTFHKCDPSVAMATFEENIDINKVITTSTAYPLEKAELLFSPVPMARSVYVTHLPADLDTKTVKSYFDSQGETHVQDVRMIEDRVSCIVFFRNSATVDILLRLTHAIAGRHVEVYRYFPCIERSEPDILTSAVYKRTTVCVSRPRNEKMDVFDINPGEYLFGDAINWKRGINCVHFECFSTYGPEYMTDTVLGEYRSMQLNINGCRTPNVTMFSRLLDNVTDANKIALDKIYLCSSSPELLQSLTEAIQEMNASTKIDCDQPIVLAQVDSDNSSTYSNKLLVTGLSEKTRETDMEKFIGSLTRYKLKTGSMVFHARKTDTAMVTFDNDIEYQCIVDTCSSHELQGCKLRFSKVQIQHCVILSKLKETVNEEMILSYFNRNGPVVHKVDVQQRKGRCLVFFDKENDANEALGTEHYFDGQTVTVHRYFTCIERSEPNIISCKRIGDFTVCVSQGNWSEMNFHEIQRHGFTHTSVTDFGVQYVHAKYIWKTSDRFKMLSSWTKRFTLKSIGYILDEYDEESIIRFISWDIIPNEVLDKIYLCSTKNDVLLRLQFALSNPSSSSSEDWPRSSLFSRTQALLTDEKSLLSTSIIPLTPESKGLLKKRRIYDTGDSDNFSSSDDDLTNPWFDRKGVKSTHYEKSQLSTRRIPVTPRSKGLLKKGSIYDTGDSKPAVHTGTKHERAKETDQTQEIIK